MKIFLKFTAILPVFAIVLAFSVNVSAETLYATTVNNDLVSFDSANACSILTSVSITGLQPDEDVLGIDFRPSNGQLYALGSTSRIYTINLATGSATAVGGQLSTLLEGGSFGFDFNPRANAEVGAIRIVSDSGQNLRINPDTLLVVVDGRLAFGTGDTNEGETPNAVGSAYTNSRTGFAAAGTTLFNIDSGLDILTRQIPPNDGTQLTVGSLGLNTNDLVGFDISTTGTAPPFTNTAFAAFKESGKTRDKGGCGNSSLFSVNIGDGLVTSLGSIGTNQPIRGLAAPIN